MTPDAAALNDARAGVLGSLHLFASMGVPTAVVKHPPITRGMAAPECVARSKAVWDPCSTPRRRAVAADLLSSVASRHPSLTSFVSLDHYFCTDRTCHVVIGGVVAYSNGSHISATYARSLARYIGPSLRRAMARQD